MQPPCSDSPSRATRWRNGSTLGSNGEPGTSLFAIEDLATYYYTPSGVVKAVDGVSLAVERSEIVGLVGESGSGKTTLALSILRLIEPPGRIVSGRILLEGDNLLEKTDAAIDRIRWRRISLVPQSAMSALNPVLKVGDQIAEAIITHEHAEKPEALKRARELLQLVGIDPARAESYPHEFSGGMKQRVIIAMALATHPALIIADEPTTGLDVMVQAQILALIRKLQRTFELAILFISHDLPLVAKICDRIAIMYAGKLVEYGGAQRLLDNPLHPYTQALLAAFVTTKGRRKRAEPIPGNVPDPIDPPAGCRFHPRCTYAMPQCITVEPRLVEIEPRHFVACHLHG